MDMVDDATNESLARMGKEETIWTAVGVLRAWIEKHGVPQTLYTDWKNDNGRFQKECPPSQFRLSEQVVDYTGC